MSYLTLQHVNLVGVGACVPAAVEENLTAPCFSTRAEAERVIASTGIERRRVVAPGTTASDLSAQAVSELLDALDWRADSVDVLLYVCTSRDYIAPITAALLQDRLGLRRDCYCLDLPLGCSGWVYGLSNLASLLSHGQLKRGLLVCAETNTLNRSPKDKSVKPLFGDAATVTALEFDAAWEQPLQFSFGIDGSGYQAVWAPYGGTRNPVTPEALQEVEVAPGIVRRGIDMVVNGMDVFSFAIKVPPAALSEFVRHFDIDTAALDYLFLHQANQFIDERIRKKLGLPAHKMPLCLKDYGNTGSASIPLTMAACAAENLRNRSCDCLGCGFGVGLAWGCVRFSTNRLRAVLLSDYRAT